MELRHLRYFLSIAENEHFTRASEKLYVTQPTLSHQIKQLEEEIGTPLFNRVGRRVKLTAAGEIFQQHARRALREIEAAQIAIEETEGLMRGTLTIGVVQTANAYLIPPAAAKITAKYQAIRIKIEELASDEIEEKLIAGTLDIGVGFAPAKLPDVVAEPLFEEDLVLIVADQHEFADQRKISLSKLNEIPLVLLNKNFCTRRLAEEGFAAGEITPRIIIEMNSIEGILQTLRAGNSSAGTILPELAARDAAGLKTILLAEPALKRTVGLLWHRTSYRTAAARAFAETIRDNIEKEFLD